MATKASWADFAILESSKGDGKKWKVQRNDEGQFRCSCPSFIFSRVQPRDCKHTRHCRSLVITDQPMPATVTARPVPVAEAETAPLLAEAKQIWAAMVAAAQIKVKHNVLDHIGRESCTHMVEALRGRLVMFNPAALAMADKAARAATTVGVRHIQFDDD